VYCCESLLEFRFFDGFLGSIDEVPYCIQLRAAIRSVAAVFLEAVNIHGDSEKEVRHLRQERNLRKDEADVNMQLEQLFESFQTRSAMEREALNSHRHRNSDTTRFPHHRDVALIQTCQKS
jgi:hypothetical protein